MPRNREIQSSPDRQRPLEQKIRPFQRITDRISERKEKRARTQEKSIDQRLDPDLENVLPSKRNIFQKREAPTPLNRAEVVSSSNNRSTRNPSRSNLGEQLDMDLASVFPPSRKNTSGRRKFGSLLGSRNALRGGPGAKSFNTKTTGYWPAPKSQANAKGKGVAAMEGGDKDREGNLIWPNHTIDVVEKKMQSGRLGPDDYVAVAMDTSAYPYGTELRSSAYPGIPFRVVDTGGAFRGKGTAKVDIATSNYDRMSQLTANNVRFEKVGGGISGMS